MKRSKEHLTGRDLARAVRLVATEASKQPEVNPLYVAALDKAAALLEGIQWPRGRHLTSNWTLTKRNEIPCVEEKQ